MCALALLGATQRPAIGSRVVWDPVVDVQGATRSLKEYAGPKGLVVFFWAGWSERSIEELKRLDAARTDMLDHGVGLVAVNVEREAASASLMAVKEKVAALGLTVPVIVDDGLKLFNAYGVVSVPSTALVDDKGKLVFFLAGYSYEQREELFDAIDRLAGVERARPAGPTVRAAPAAVRRLLFGRAQLAGGRVTAARSSFETAAAADAGFADPVVELAALALDEENVPRARAMLDKALALEKDHALARVELARAQFLQGQVGEAQQALEAIGANPLALAYLGFVLLAGEKTEEASAVFRRVVEGGAPDPRGELGAAAALTPAAAAQRMTQYRRTTAASRR